MKTIGIIFLVFAGMNFIAFIIGICSGVDGNLVVQQLSGALMLAGLGAFLVHRANRKSKRRKIRRSGMMVKQNNAL